MESITANNPYRLAKNMFRKYVYGIHEYLFTHFSVIH
jgi:hypothetical protein